MHRISVKSEKVKTSYLDRLSNFCCRKNSAPKRVETYRTQASTRDIAITVQKPAVAKVRRETTRKLDELTEGEKILLKP